VQPKRIALAESQAQLDAAQTKLAKIMAKIQQLDDALKVLTDKFQAATGAKLKCQQEAEARRDSSRCFCCFAQSSQISAHLPVVLYLAIARWPFNPPFVDA